jgi:hypothetical protein
LLWRKAVPPVFLAFALVSLRHGHVRWFVLDYSGTRLKHVAKCPLCLRKRTCAAHQAMSALGQERAFGQNKRGRLGIRRPLSGQGDFPGTEGSLVLQNQDHLDGSFVDRLVRARLSSSSRCQIKARSTSVRWVFRSLSYFSMFAR